MQGSDFQNAEGRGDAGGDSAGAPRAVTPESWFDASAPPSAPPEPRLPPPCFNPLDTVCLVVVGVHLLALALMVLALPYVRSPRMGREFPFDCLIGSHLPLLTLWLWCGPRPLWLRACAAGLAGLIVGIVIEVTLGIRGSSAFEVAAFYVIAPISMCFYLMVGLWFFAAEFEVVRAAPALPGPRKVVQFTIRSMVVWTLLAALMLALGKWLAASPDAAGAFFVLLGALWGVWTGLLMLREPFFPVPRVWQLLSLVVGACAFGAIAGLGIHSIPLGVSFLLTATSGVGTLLLLRPFGYRLKITTLEKHLQKVRAIVLPESEPPEEAWRDIEDQVAAEPAEPQPDVPA